VGLQARQARSCSAPSSGGPDWCLNLILDVDCGTFWNVVFQTPVIRGAFL
jgi:hypothetical protein